MKATLFRRHGDREVLEHAEVPDPVPGARDVVVRMKACALHPPDVRLCPPSGAKESQPRLEERQYVRDLVLEP